MLVSPKAEFHPTKLNSDKGSTQLRQGRFNSDKGRFNSDTGRFNSDKTRFSPDRQYAELLWDPARFLLSLLFLAALYEGEKCGSGRTIFWNNSLNMFIRVMAPYRHSSLSIQLKYFTLPTIYSLSLVHTRTILCTFFLCHWVMQPIIKTLPAE